MQNGNVPIILDGFDELLHRTNENTYENTEPMLSTIGELLKKHAKIILTTRRTAIFDGDEFHNWMDEHSDDFKIIRYRIDEPTINDWLPHQRLDSLQNQHFPIGKLANPVLLSFLRCISDEKFKEILQDSSLIVEKYFNSMLERENSTRFTYDT